VFLAFLVRREVGLGGGLVVSKGAWLADFVFSLDLDGFWNLKDGDVFKTVEAVRMLF
jgi:hypothetical protein